MMNLKIQTKIRKIKILKININSKKINVSFNGENKYYNAEYYLIKEGLHKYFNIDKFKIMYTKNGKPFLDKDVYLSISHDKDIVVVALSNVRVGIDIQYYRKLDNITTNSINKMLNITNNTITNFSIKEAILKLNGDVFKSINNYDINNYHIISQCTKKYIIICVYHKYMIK